MAQWRRLFAKHLDTHGLLLHVKAEIADSSYAIYITDFVRIWGEKLDRRGIMRRAMDENTSIDPTNGPDQLKHLLEHIAKCLQGDPGTTSVISTKSDMQLLKLSLTSTLPAPLEPLHWPMTFVLADQACFSSELLLPTLKSLKSYHSGFDGLLNVIKEKDSLLQKLQDKLEVAGIDVGTIFPGVSRKHEGTSRAPTDRAIPGLEEFDCGPWIQTVEGLTHDPIAIECLPQLLEIDATKVTQWWDDLPASDAEEAPMPDSPLIKHSGTKFSIPDRQRNRKSSLSSTSSEEDASNTRIAQTALGVATVSSSNAVEPHLSTELDYQDSPTNPFNEQREAETRETTRNSMRRIGKLGGMKVETDADVSATGSESTRAEPPTDQKISPLKKRLGRIGGSSKANDIKVRVQSELNVAQSGEDPTRVNRESLGAREALEGKAETSSGAVRDERETSQERADRRRAELKRQLEEKKKGPGVKKKQRKF